MEMEQWARVRRKILIEKRSKRSVMKEEDLHPDDTDNRSHLCHFTGVSVKHLMVRPLLGDFRVS